MEEFPILSFVIAAFIAGVSATIPPGPIFAMTVTESARRGFKAGLLVVLGHAAVEVAVVAALVLGLGVIIGSEPVKILLCVIGGLILIWMGCNLVKQPRKPVAISEKESPREELGPIIKGVVAAVGNPYFILWWTVVGGAFMFRGLALLGPMGPFIFLMCHWLSDFPWFSFVSFSVDKGRIFLGSRVYRMIVVGCGAFLIALGLTFIRDGAALLMRW